MSLVQPGIGRKVLKVPQSPQRFRKAGKEF